MRSKANKEDDGSKEELFSIHVRKALSSRSSLTPYEGTYLSIDFYYEIAYSLKFFKSYMRKEQLLDHFWENYVALAEVINTFPFD